LALPRLPKTPHNHGDCFTHYRGGVYVWLMEAKLEADETLMVVYRQQSSGWVFVRPASEFYGMTNTAEGQIARFTKIIGLTEG